MRWFVVYDGIGAALWAGLGIYLGSLFSTPVDDLLNVLPQLGQYWMILVAVRFSDYQQRAEPGIFQVEIVTEKNYNVN